MRLRKRKRRPARRRRKHKAKFNDREDVLSTLFGLKDKNRTPKFKPSVDIKKNEDGFKISVELPGVEKENVNVAVEEGLLKVRGKKELSEEERENTYRSERKFGEFERDFKVPNKVNENKIEAGYKNGILNILLPVDEDKNKQEISIN